MSVASRGTRGEGLEDIIRKQTGRRRTRKRGVEEEDYRRRTRRGGLDEEDYMNKTG